MTSVVAVKQRRAGLLGASDAPTVLGLVPGKGPINVWLRFTGRAGDEPPNEMMEFGTAYEPVIRSKYVERTGSHVWVPSESIVHPEHPIQATPDGVVLRTMTDAPTRADWSHALEIKAPKSRSRPDWGDDYAPTVPPRVLAQVAVQLAVLDLPYADVAAEIDREYVQRRVERDLDLEQEIVGALLEFWQCVVTDSPPAVDETESYASYLRKKLEKAAQRVQATPEMNALAGRWRELEADIKRRTVERDLVKNMFMEQMATHSALAVDTEHGPIRLVDGRVTNDYEALAKDFATRLQLRGEVVDLNEEKKRFQTQGAPYPRRPNNWSEG